MGGRSGPPQARCGRGIARAAGLPKRRSQDAVVKRRRPSAGQLPPSWCTMTAPCPHDSQKEPPMRTRLSRAAGLLGVALAAALPVLAAPVPGGTTETLKDRSNFIPQRKYQALPGKAVG